MNLMNFKIQSFFTTLIIGTVSALTISDAISQKVNAQAAPSCNNATIKGSYGAKFTGTIVTSYSVASIGLYNFNGTGKFQATSSTSESFNGTVTKNTPESGTYSVKQDCTVQIVSGSSTYSGVIVDGGKEIFVLVNILDSVITGTLKKV